MISGMAMGVDTIWARLAIANGIPLIAAVPFIGQEAKWRKPDKIIYNELLEQAYELHIINDIPSVGFGNFRTAYLTRDEWMVDHANMVVAVLNKRKRSSGTAQTARYAEKQKVPVTYINPDGWRL